MRLRPPDLEIPPDNPFANDALERAKLEPTLTEFVTQAIGPFTLAVDGGWGTGKTTFLKMWQPKLETRGHICLYFNAWETDFASDPLIAMVGELSQRISELLPSGKRSPALRQHLKTAKKLAGSVAKRAIPAAVKVITTGAVDLNEAIEKEIIAAAGKVAEDQVEIYEKSKSEVKKFRTALASLVDELVKTQPRGDRKVVIIVDELDRCRPTYAIELLERIKHLFDTPRVAFVLGIDRQQLAHSVKAVYGGEFDASGYLKRFIDLDYKLPEPQKDVVGAYLLKTYGIDRIVEANVVSETDDLKRISTTLKILCTSHDLSLRSLAQVVSRLRVTLQTIPRTQLLHPEALTLLVFLREVEPRLFLTLRQEETQECQLHSWLVDTLKRARVWNEMVGCVLQAIAISGLAELGFREGKEQLEYLAGIRNNQRSAGSREVRMADLLDNVGRRGPEGDRFFRLTLSRVELAEPFQENGEKTPLWKEIWLKGGHRTGLHHPTRPFAAAIASSIFSIDRFSAPCSAG